MRGLNRTGALVRTKFFGCRPRGRYATLNAISRLVYSRSAKSLTRSVDLLRVGQTRSPNSIVLSGGPKTMKNVYEVLRQKELELARLEKEVEALRVAAPLLSEESAGETTSSKPTLTTPATQQPIRIPQPAVTTTPAVQTARAAGWEETAKRWP
jgi:hypothetical protein